jgi:nitric oxide reductase NorE protein
VLLGGDFLVFSLFFTTYAWYWQSDPELFSQSQSQVNTLIGFANTLLLLTGSWLVASGMRQVRLQQRRQAAKWMGLAGVTGIMFLLNKGIEWNHLFSQGVALDTNNYYIMFFMLTGIHGLHVIIGTALLFYAYLRLRNPAAPAPTEPTLEWTALFWHLVDVLWIVLFALVYLVS